jgi:hypothetical protein
MTSSASTTEYNRAYDHCNINDLFTPDKIIDGFLLHEKGDLVNPCYSHSLQEVEAVPQSLWEYNVSQEQWSKLRNGILFQQKSQESVDFVCFTLGFITFFSFIILLSLVASPSKCKSSCKSIVSTYFPGGKYVLDGLLISLLTTSLLSFMAAILYRLCWLEPALHRICRETQLGTTNNVISLRICSNHDYSWIELYIPSSFSIPQPV